MTAPPTHRVPWTAGTWSVPPAAVTTDADDLLVTCAAQSDLWRTTSYGFVHDSGHGLLAPLPDGTAVEVTFVVTGEASFDQAGLLVRGDAQHWVKAGVELADGDPQIGAVVTDERSDWSAWPVPGWLGQVASVRASRAGDALTVRARLDGTPWQLLRLAPIDPALPWAAGPFACAPSRGGFVVRFTRWATGPADAALHAEG